MSQKDSRAKSIFTVVIEWSDHGSRSPTRTGQLPLAAITPSGERVGLTCLDIQIEQYNRNVPYNSWAKMGHDVSAKESGWGDNGSRSYGRSGARVEVLAPAGTIFVFERGCNACGDSLGEILESALVHRRAPVEICSECQAISDEEDRLVDEQEREEQAYHQEHSLPYLSELTGISYRVLALKAAQGKMVARKDGKTWLASVADVEDAIAGGYIRRQKTAG